MKELTLQERKEISFKILCKIDEICKKNNIKYYLGYGTLIGAIRHNGFIPWDDDIDIWVKLEQYNKLIELINKDSEYEIVNTFVDPAFPLLFTKVSDKTTFVEKIDKSKGDFKRGIAVDVFPLCNGLPKSKIKRIQFSFLQRMNKLISLYDMGALNTKKISDLFMNLFCKICHILNLNSLFWRTAIMSFIEKLPESEFLMNPFSPYKQKDIHNKKCFEDIVEVTFENKKFYAPARYDEVLRNIYGDYMKLPPEEKRISNHSVKAYKL